MSEDSTRCQRAPEINKDDRRYRGAYHLLHSHMAMLIASGHLAGLPKAEAEALLDSMEAELHPPEFEDVPVVRWECQKCGFIHRQDRKPVACAGTVNGSWCGEGDDFTKLTGTVKRPIRRMVIREYEVAAVITKAHPLFLDGAAICAGSDGGMKPIFADHPECHGKAGVLIFRTAE